MTNTQLHISCDEATAAALEALLAQHPGVRSVTRVQPAPAPSNPPADKRDESDAAVPPPWSVTPTHCRTISISQSLRKEALSIHTDGSCSGNPGPIGMSVVVHDAQEVRAAFGWGGGHGTSAAAEVCAVLSALNLAAQRRAHSVSIYTDSEYVVKCLTSTYQKWQRTGFDNVPNGQLWQALLQQKAHMEDVGVQVSVEWTRGHAGGHFNEVADKLAVKARKAQAYIREQ